MTTRGNKLWLMASAFDLSQQMLEIQHCPNPRLRLPNFDVLAEEADTFDILSQRDDTGSQLRPLMALSEPLLLELTEPGYAPNILELGFPLVSAELRDAIGQDDTIQWLPVDASGSTQDVISKDYRIMHVRPIVEAVDTVRSDGKCKEIPSSDGESTATIWEPARLGPHQPPSAFFWIPNFVPPAAVFYETLKQVVLVTEQTAKRIRDAGINDVIFIDMENDGTNTEPVLRE